MIHTDSHVSHLSPERNNSAHLSESTLDKTAHGEIPSSSSIVDDRGYDSPLNAPPPAVTYCPPKSEDHSPVHYPSHRRSKTEFHPLPRVGSTHTRHESISHPPSATKVGPEGTKSCCASNPSPNQSKSERSGNFFSGLFQGESTSFKFGLVPPAYVEAAENRRNRLATDFTQMAQSVSSLPASKLHKRMTVPSPLKQVTSSNRFSFFGSKTQETEQLGLPEPADDKYLNLDVNAALFPQGSTDLPTPEAIKTLQNNAETLIRELQMAYKSRTFALHEAIAEKTTQEEELEETRCRFQNIKSQLDGMAGKVLEQDKTMQTLMSELSDERQKRQQEEEVRRRTVVLTKPSSEQLVDEDGQFTRRHSKRSSDITFTSDSGFESGDESTAESIFSKKMDGTASSSATIRTSRAPSPDSAAHVQPASPPSPADGQAELTSPKSPAPSTLSISTAPSTPPVQTSQPNRSSQPAQPVPTSKPSTYDRVMKGLSSTSFGGAFMNSNKFSTTTKCTNCYGATASDAWSVVSIMREENRGLKNRIADLEAAVEECITLVGG